MIRYTVVWHALALQELADLWITAANRESVSRAAYEIDHQLATDPETRGVQVSARSRELSVAPLHVLFRIRSEDRLVEVFSATFVSEIE